MSEPFRISLVPLGANLTLPAQASLQDALFAYGVEFPCGGQGHWQGLPRRGFGWALGVTRSWPRLPKASGPGPGLEAARPARPETRLQVEAPPLEGFLPSDDVQFAFAPRPGLGIAIDLGT